MGIEISLDFVRLDVTRNHALKILNMYVCVLHWRLQTLGETAYCTFKETLCT
jgi:hypothetical protein